MLKYSSLSISFGSKMSSSSSSSFTLLFQTFVYVNIIIILTLIDSRVIISDLNCSLNKYFCMSLFHYSLFGGSLISLWSLTLKGIPFTEPMNWLGNCSLRFQEERVIVLQGLCFYVSRGLFAITANVGFTIRAWRLYLPLRCGEQAGKDPKCRTLGDGTELKTQLYCWNYRLQN